jgi:glycosyltransferase involved in cell wall biosynthesis
MLRAIFSRAYSRVLIVGDNSGWVIDEESRLLKRTLEKLGIKASLVRRTPWNLPQVVHYGSQFALNDDSIYQSKHRLSIDYFHGKPGKDESFRKCFESLKRNHEKLSRVRVSNKAMEEVILSSGIARDKVRRIPIGVDLEAFRPRTQDSKLERRRELDIPQEVFVVGSFQKDGVGWGEGLEPKLIKGPDVFLSVIEKLKKEIPDLFILLSGPSRGFVKQGLEKLGVPYRHLYPKESGQVARLYDALDLYLVASREEGGPKAVLDSMAKGVPLVTTEVGQAADLVRAGVNAMMAPIEDTEALARACLEVGRDESLRARLVEGGFATARENSFESQLPLWKEYFAPLID